MHLSPTSVSHLPPNGGKAQKKRMHPLEYKLSRKLAVVAVMFPECYRLKVRSTESERLLGVLRPFGKCYRKRVPLDMIFPWWTQNSHFGYPNEGHFLFSLDLLGPPNQVRVKPSQHLTTLQAHHAVNTGNTQLITGFVLRSWR